MGVRPPPGTNIINHLRIEIAEAFQATKVDDFPLPPWDYNVAPTTMEPIIRQSRHTGERELVQMR